MGFQDDPNNENYYELSVDLLLRNRYKYEDTWNVK